MPTYKYFNLKKNRLKNIWKIYFFESKNVVSYFLVLRYKVMLKRPGKNGLRRGLKKMDG